jgi:hypothetical protein
MGQLVVEKLRNVPSVPVFFVEAGPVADVGDVCGLCFPAGTLVRTMHGLVPIEKIRIGDEVLSRNPKTGKLGYKKVIGLAKPHSDKLLKLRFAGSTHSLDATPDHQFFAKPATGEAGVWAPATKLRTGDLILNVKGTWTKVTAISRVEDERTVYNFEVEENHDYFVGSIGLLVHNGPCEPPDFQPDPTQPPGPDWEWRGQQPEGGDQGSWYNPSTDESFHPDLGHPDPIGPHYDYIDPEGNQWRVFPDGTVLPK